MSGYVECEYCKGAGKTFQWWIFPIRCPHCNGVGYVWKDNIDEYFKEKYGEEDDK